MSTRPEPITEYETHRVQNQASPLMNYNSWTADPLLPACVEREGGGWINEQAASLGAVTGAEHFQRLAMQANRYAPELKTHDRYGNRQDIVEFHPSYHELMDVAFSAGLHSLSWSSSRSGRFVARAALFYLWNQLEQGTSCPVTMTFGSVPTLRHAPQIAQRWMPRITANSYDSRRLPMEKKTGVTIGMAMTEKQGGSDLRAIETRAVKISDQIYQLRGHKWFCSAPMSDAFLTLAKTDAGVTCFFVPRLLDDGTINPIHIQRLKDKLGNRSNASSEIEYHNTQAWLIGEEGRGIATLIDMAHHTRFDITVAVAAMMRLALNEAIQHASTRRAFGRHLIDQPLMQNVLADLALEAEAALLLAFRLARAFDQSEISESEKMISRLLTPVAKFWLCKRMIGMSSEAMECLGGNGYVEEGTLARLYREAPVNGIWEGSGNVICLDVLRAMQREPAIKDTFFSELLPVANHHPALAAALGKLQEALKDNHHLEQGARRITGQMACLMQAALMIQHAPVNTASAFCESRLHPDLSGGYGNLATGADFSAIIGRARLVL